MVSSCNEWPKAAAIQGWYCQALSLLFHACEVCLCKLIKITTATAADCPIALNKKEHYTIKKKKKKDFGKYQKTDKKEVVGAALRTQNYTK